MTLAFIGDYGNPDEVLDVMGQVEFRPIEMSLDGVGSFGELFWAGLAANPQLVGYVKRLRRTLFEQGIPFDRKQFSPHITLIRKYSCRGGREIPVSDPPKGSMIATKVSLHQRLIHFQIVHYFRILLTRHSVSARQYHTP